MLFLNDVLLMHGGFVLNFTDRTFSRFFVEELEVNIDDPKFAAEGGSKAKRLRYFLQTVDNATAARALQALWEYREAVRQREKRPEALDNAHQQLLALISQLQGHGAAPTVNPESRTSVDNARLAGLRSDLVALACLKPHPRGYAFERFLTALFDCYGLQAREPFRLRGEQIDGSFQLAGETYLVEAKWQSPPIDAAALHTFHGKLEQKAAWSRGLFISDSGFTAEGLDAFGRGKRVVCMDGLDLSDTLTRSIPLQLVLERKVRHAAETGIAFVRVRDLFPSR